MALNALQYILANPNRGFPISKKSVPISEFVRISEVTLFLWRFNNTKYVTIQYREFNSLSYTLNICNERCKLFTLLNQVNTYKYGCYLNMKFENEVFGLARVRIREVRINEGLLY